MKVSLTNLGSYIEEARNRIGKEQKTVYSVTNDRGFVSSLDVFDKQVFSKDISNYKLVDFNELAYNPSRINVGSVAICNDKNGGAVSPMYTIIHCKEGLLPQYLLYFLKSEQGLFEINRRTEGAVRFQLKYKDLERIEIYLPPLPEQERIVRLLDEAEALRTLRTQADTRMEEFVPALFFEMFGDPIINLMNWNVLSLEEIAKIERGRFSPRPRNDPKYYGGVHPFVQTGDIAASNGYLTTWSQTLNELGIKVSKCFDTGTILIAIVGATIGETTILGIKTYTPDSAIGITVNPNKAIPEYVEFVLRYWKPIFRSQAPETARANINLGIIKSVNLPVPPLSLQHEFAERVKEAREVQSAQVRSEEKIEALYQSMLDRAFKGEF